jgi:glycosyltransferase involved in cell wall biosynthesis
VSVSHAALRTAVIVPAYEASATVGDVVRDLVRCWPHDQGVLVVDDGSLDDTSDRARRAGAAVVRHGRNRGKGAALRTGLHMARGRGFAAAVTVDADGQHPAEEALRLARLDAPPEALVLGIRDLPGAGAPRANQMSNRISNYFLSRFTSMDLADTQCGLRRYPVIRTLQLDGRSRGYAFEAEILLLAVRAGLPIVQVPVHVLYDGPRQTHFHVARDPARIIGRVLWTLARGRLASPTVSPRPTPHES